jgi:hypothetical protein
MPSTTNMSLSNRSSAVGRGQVDKCVTVEQNTPIIPLPPPGQHAEVHRAATDDEECFITDGEGDDDIDAEDAPIALLPMLCLDHVTT